MAKKLYRSTTDKQIAGVCGGLADYLGLDVGMVRGGMVLAAVFTSAPVLLAYLVAAMALPEGETAPVPACDLDWQADGLRVSYKAASVPHAVPWYALVLPLIALAGFASVVFGVLGALTAMPVDTLLPMALAGVSLMWPAAVAAFVFAVFPRTYALTVTHDALWLERPMRKARRIDLVEVQDFHAATDAFTIHLQSGELVRFPAVPEQEAREALREQLAASRRRADEHHEDVGRAETERRRVEAVAARRAQDIG